MGIKELLERAKSSWMARHHMLLMVLCCLVPIVAIAGLSLAGVRNAFLSFAMVLVCPLSMVIMMLLMFKSRKRGTGDGPVQ